MPKLKKYKLTVLNPPKGAKRTVRTFDTLSEAQRIESMMLKHNFKVKIERTDKK